MRVISYLDLASEATRNPSGRGGWVNCGMTEVLTAEGCLKLAFRTPTLAQRSKLLAPSHARRKLATLWVVRTTYGVSTLRSSATEDGRWQNGVATLLANSRMGRTHPRWAPLGPGTKRRGGLPPSRRTPHSPWAVQVPDGFSPPDGMAGERLRAAHLLPWRPLPPGVLTT